MSQGSAEPLRARINGPNWGILRGKRISDHGLVSSYESQQRAVNGQDSWGVFQGCTRFSTAGCCLARQLHQLKAFNAMDLGTTVFIISV